MPDCSAFAQMKKQSSMPRRCGRSHSCISALTFQKARRCIMTYGLALQFWGVSHLFRCVYLDWLFCHYTTEARKLVRIGTQVLGCITLVRECNAITNDLLGCMRTFSSFVLKSSTIFSSSSLAHRWTILRDDLIVRSSGFFVEIQLMGEVLRNRRLGSRHDHELLKS